jgi:hypothetical protein
MARHESKNAQRNYEQAKLDQVLKRRKQDVIDLATRVLRT